MVKKAGFGVMIVLGSLLMAGCWDSQDISERSVVIVAAADLTQDNTTQFGDPRQYDATILIPNLDPETPEKVRIERVSGASLSGSRDQRTYINSETIIVRMVHVFLFGESLAAAGLAPPLDSIQRNPLASSALHLAITDGDPGELLRVVPRDFPDLGVFLTDMLMRINNKAFFPVVSLHDFQVQSTTRGKNPVLPILKVDQGEVKISGLGIFKKDKFIRKVGLDESRPLSLLRCCHGQAYVPFLITRKGEVVDRGTTLLRNDRQIKVEREGGQITYNITITLKGELVEHENPVDLLSNPDYLSFIEEQIAADMESECRDFIQKMQEEIKVDCIDISKYALAKWRNELEDSIDDGFIEKVNINVDVKVHIQNTGDLT